TSKFELSLGMTDDGEGLHGKFDYRTDLFEAETIKRLTGHFEQLLNSIVASPETRLSLLPILSPTEQQQLLYAWNDTETDFPSGLCAHQLFEAQAARTPDALAIVFGDERLTYRELNERTNRLAHHLQSLGVGAEVRVGVLLNRSVEMIVAVLAIVKAGGAYVPLDTNWPQQRVQWILSSLAVNCLLTESAEYSLVHDLQWQLPQLSNVVCLDTETPQPPAEPLNSELVQSLWDHVAEHATDIVTAGGFVSSYTGEPFALTEVAEYRDRVVMLAENSLGVGRRRVMEIGCGAGLIMFELAREAEVYVGIDPSEITQARN